MVSTFLPFSYQINTWQGIHLIINCNDKSQLTIKSVIQFKVGNERIIHF